MQGGRYVSHMLQDLDNIRDDSHRIRVQQNKNAAL